MPKLKSILFFGLAEILIGSVTLLSILESFLLKGYAKPANVLAFVITSSAISIVLGIGILRRYRLARKLLVFFSGWVILTKALIFLQVITLCCELETSIPSTVKNTCSVIYHLVLIFTLRRPGVKKELNR